MTIDTAISGIKEFYSPIVKTNPAEDFNDDFDKLSNLNPIDVAKYPWTDIGQGWYLQIFIRKNFVMFQNVNLGSITKMEYGHMILVD